MRGAPAHAFRSAAAMAAAAASAALLALPLDGCSLRDRSNPLDPKNRATQGLLPGFNALAGDRLVELRWPLLALEGVIGYRVERWRPGEEPRLLPGADYAPHVGAAEDTTARNDSTYVYRLIARLSSGGVAASSPDTATPGARRAVVLTSSPDGLVALTPDARDVLYRIQESEAYDDLELDQARGLLWMCQYDLGRVVRRRLDGTIAGAVITIQGPADIALGTKRGWVARPDAEEVSGFPDSTSTTPDVFVAGVGRARVVEGGPNASLWIGSDDGRVHRADALDGSVEESWQLPNPIAAIAVDPIGTGAWVATRAAGTDQLFRLSVGEPVPRLVRSDLIGVTDLEMDPTTRAFWMSERGAPLAGHGRLSRLDATGATLVTITGLEPYALAVDPGSGHCWVTDLASDRLLEVRAEGSIVRRSPELGVPYAVRVHLP